MDKKYVCLTITLIGLLIITFVEVWILIDDDKEKGMQTFLEKNLINETKKCVRSGKCEEGQITIRTLIDNEYLDEKYLSLLSDYSLDSYVDYPSMEVNLRKKETAILHK